MVGHFKPLTGYIFEISEDGKSLVHITSSDVVSHEIPAFGECNIQVRISYELDSPEIRNLLMYNRKTSDTGEISEFDTPCAIVIPIEYYYLIVEFGAKILIPKLLCNVNFYEVEGNIYVFAKTKVLDAETRITHKIESLYQKMGIAYNRQPNGYIAVEDNSSIGLLNLSGINSTKLGSLAELPKHGTNQERL
jgi:hypothetical protein